jgi:NDP-sugar pyrophosphorylase family protein
MKAMILAAGLGTRLRAMTATRPEGAGPDRRSHAVGDHATRLRDFGVTDVIVNVHHFAEMIVEYLQAHDNFGLHIEISREDLLLDTGGGLKKAGWFFAKTSEPIILHNVDVISTVDFSKMFAFHRANDALATLAVQKRESSRYLIFDEHSQLCGWRR